MSYRARSRRPLHPLATRLSVAVVAVLGVSSLSVVQPPTRAAAALSPPVVTSTTSSGDATLRNATNAPQQMSALGSPVTGQVIGVDTAATYQQMLGVGASLESSSIYNITHVSAANRSAIVSSLFAPNQSNTNLARLSFGCPDFCAEPFYTYDDQPTGQTDTDLSDFSIGTDITAGIVSVAKQALALNPGLRFYAAPWSPPAWMKDNGSLKGGGTVLPAYYQVLADYYVKAIQAYTAQGIPIYAFSPQNEPTVAPDYPSAAWTWQQERDFVKVLGATFRARGITTQIWIQDDNILRTPEFAGNILDDLSAAQYVQGVALHDYEGDPTYTGDLGLIDTLHARHPNVQIHMTERSYYGTAGIDRLVQDFRHWMSSWTWWLTFLDDQGQPNSGPLDARGSILPVTAPHGALDQYRLTEQYWLYGQLSRYVQRGAYRVDSDPGSTATVTDVAFVNPDGTTAVVTVNQTSTPQTYTLITPDGQLTATAAANSVTTSTWHRTTGVSIDRRGWSVAASIGDPAQLATDLDTRTRWTTSSAQTPGQDFWIDMGSVQRVDRVTLDQLSLDGGASAADFPRGIAISTSTDGHAWSPPIATGAGTSRITSIAFTPVSTRWLRIRQTGTAPNNWWSIGEVFVHAA